MKDIGFGFAPYHPGDLLKEELEYRGISQKDFAKQIGVGYAIVNEVLNGKRPVSADFAYMAEAALGVEPKLLIRLQADFDIQVAATDNKLRERLNKIRRFAAVL